MTTERKWYWITKLITPREKISQLSQLPQEFLPETLVLDRPDLCFFRFSQRVPSSCLVIAASQGRDSLELTQEALLKIENATYALMIQEHCFYETQLFHYALDELPDEFKPSEERFLESRFNRRPPLTLEGANSIRNWYALFSNSQNERLKNQQLSRAIELMIQGLIRNDEFKGVKFYTAYEELREIFDGEEGLKRTLNISKETIRKIERARRPVAHGGSKAIMNEPLSELQAVAATASIQLLAAALKHYSSHNKRLL